MNGKLYYQDAYIQTFTSQLIKQEYDQNGTLYAVLEETAFYPTGGGQPHDTGTLNGIYVWNVEETGGEIRHYIESELTERDVSGHIDWGRRFDHMQQHAGQHILSAAFADSLNMPTLSFHLGQENCTIDIETAELTMDAAQQAEKIANEIVFDNRPILTRWVNEQEASMLPLRKQLSVTENIRLVIIEHFDYNGCGGTHPQRTGEVGTIKITDWERNKGNVRVTFVCGWRALRTMHEQQIVVKRAAQLVHSKESDVPARLEQLLAAQKETEKALRDANDALLTSEADSLLARAIEQDHIIAAAFENRAMPDIAKLSGIITKKNPHAVVLFVTKNSDYIQCLCARGKEATPNMNDVIQKILPLIHGKGGGNAMSARGGGTAAVESEAVLRILIDAVI